MYVPPSCCCLWAQGCLKAMRMTGRPHVLSLRICRDHELGQLLVTPPAH